MTEPKTICTVSLGGPVIDNDYTLYEDGTVKRFYDRNMYSLNNESLSKAGQLPEYIKKKLLEKCSEELKEQAKKLLYP